MFFVGGPGEQQHCQDSLGLISQPLLQTTGGSVRAISTLGQIMWTGCLYLASMLARFLLTLTQHSRWRPIKYPAPTTEEIFDLLPGLTEPEHGKHVWIQMHKNRDKSYTIKLMDMRISSQIKQGVFNKSLADAAAKMWLYLKKEGLI